VLDSISGVALMLAWFTPVGKIGKVLGLGEKAIKGLIFGLRGVAVGTAVTSIALKGSKEAFTLGADRADTLFKSFNEISKVGVSLSGELGGVGDTLQTLGMTVSELDEFNSLIRAGSKDLALLGGTAGRGMKQFSEVAGEMVKGDLGRELNQMGVDNKEQRALALDFAAIQARTGQMQLTNTKNLVTQTGKFVKELDLAARLTGDSREEQAKKIRSAQMDERFRAAQREADITNNGEARQRLDNASKLAAKFMAVGAEDEAKGLQHIAATYATTGQITPGVSEQSTKLFFTYGADAIKQALDTGGIQGFADLVKAGERMSDSTLRIQQQLGRFGPLTSGVGQFESQQLIKDLEKAKAEENFSGTLDQFLETERGKQIAQDKLRTTLVDVNRTNQNAGLVMDQAVNSMMGAADISLRASQAFEAAVKQFAEVTGIKATPGGLLKTGDLPGSNVNNTTPTNLSPAAKANVDKLNVAKVETAAKEDSALVANDKLKAAKDELAQLLKNGQRNAETDKKIIDLKDQIPKLEAERIKAEADLLKASRDEAEKQLRTNIDRKNHNKGIRELESQIRTSEAEIATAVDDRSKLYDKKTDIEKKLKDDAAKAPEKQMHTYARGMYQADLKKTEKQLAEAEASLATKTETLASQREKLKKLAPKSSALPAAPADDKKTALPAAPADSKNPAPADSKNPAPADDKKTAPADSKNPAPADSKKTAPTKSAQPANSNAPPGRTDLLSGLTIKSTESIAGGNANPRLIELAKRIQEQYPDAKFTALNDLYHQKNFPNSKHTKGEALDFALSVAPNKEQGEAIRKFVQDLGFSKVFDEYNNPQSGSTGGHIHAELKNGGVVTAKSGGTVVRAAEAGLNEAYVPLPNGKSIPVEISGQMQNTMQQQTEAVYTQNEKLDELIMLMRKQNDTSVRILQVSQA
jgi:hypothetical protein